MLAPVSRLLPILTATMLLMGCDGARDKGPVRVDVIGTREELKEPLRNATRPPAQTILAATAQGIVAFNASGDVVSGLAERWIMEDDGASFIFRLKRARWPNGDPVKAQEVAKLLAVRMKAMPQFMAGLEPEVRGMTDLVVEVTLPGPMPSFLQLLAQPAMAIARKSGGGTGPFREILKGDVATLEPIKDPALDPPSDGDNAVVPDRPIYVRTVRAALGFARFQRRQTDLLLGGRFEDLPFTAVVDLREGAVRADPVKGLFGLIIESTKHPFLQSADTREILSIAVDRDRIANRLNLSGWQATTTILPEALDMDHDPAPPRWAYNGLAQRQGYARSVVQNWATTNGGPPPPLSIALPAGPGARLLYASLADDYHRIGLTLVPVAWNAPADLHLIDEVAPYDSALWYLARLGCGLNALCATDATAKLKEAIQAPDEVRRGAALGEAETLTLGANTYVPLGMPIRFALVRSRLTGYRPSPRARHPLNALFQPPR